MKISKTRLKEIIKEELSGLGEVEKTDQDAEVRLQRVASSLGAHEDFVAKVREAITNAVSSEGMGWDRALGTMVDALEMLSPMQEGDEPDEEASDDDDALVLPDRGAAGVKKSRERLKRQANDLERQKRLRYKK